MGDQEERLINLYFKATVGTFSPGAMAQIREIKKSFPYVQETALFCWDLLSIQNTEVWGFSIELKSNMKILRDLVNYHV